MKKHVDYKVALSVGLFSLSTLSSCVNTGQTYMGQTGDTGPISQVSSSKEKDGSSITTGSVQPSMVLSEETLAKLNSMVSSDRSRWCKIREFKSFAGSVSKDVEKHIKNHGMLCEQDVNDCLNKVRKEIEEKI